MSTDTVFSATDGAAATRRDRGVVERLIALPSSLPGPALLWSVLLFLLLIAVPTAVIWLIGSQPIGQLDPHIWLPALISAFCVGVINLLDQVARTAFGHFEHALGDRPDKDELRSRLTAMPDGMTVAIVLVIDVIATIGYFSEADFQYLMTRPPVEIAVIVIVSSLSIGLSAVLMVHSLVQLRFVDRLHREADSVDLFDPGPAHAFARLTAATGIGLLVLGIAVLADPTASRDNVFYALEGAFVIGIAGAAFAIPLRGMHARLTAEKGRLLRATNERIKETIARIHGDVDSRDLTRTVALESALRSLIAERDLISKMSTWPWSAGTLRGFGSALLIPIVLWLITRGLGRFV